VVVLGVIIGRFVWVFGVEYASRVLGIGMLKRRPPWQNLFIVSWSGMRGGISLAAALAVPYLPYSVNGVNPRDLLIFLVFMVIIATLLLQGMTLPWLMSVLKVKDLALQEKYDEHLHELKVRLKLINSVLHWLIQTKKQNKEDPRLCDELSLYTQQYRMLKRQFKERIQQHDGVTVHDTILELKNSVYLSSQIIEVERTELLRMWREDKVSYTVKNKLLQQLDHLSRRYT
jgi:CPA1 family monovalent cation:H+ antiporter